MSTISRKTNHRRPPAAPKRPVNAPPPPSDGDRNVRRLRLSRALTVPDAITVSDACKRMANRQVDAALLTDANGLLSGILTDKDVAARVIAEGLRPEQTAVAKVMTRNPVFAGSETPAIEALQKMVHGKFRHLPIVENGEVIAMLDIAKCLYDAISRMEKAAEQGSAIAAAVEGVERHWGGKFSAQQAFIETLRDRMFKPTLSTIITENTKLVVVSSSDPVYLATRKMREHRATSVVVAVGGKPQGILTSKDVLCRIVAQNLCPELTFVEKERPHEPHMRPHLPMRQVMTANPECATVDTTILDALHIMHDGRFLHLPVLDHDGCIIACLDVLQITHAAISLVEGGPGSLNDVTGMMMQKFWDSGLPFEPPDDDCDNHSEISALLTSDGPESTRAPSMIRANSFTFKFVDQKGRVHRFSCGSDSLSELVSAIHERAGLAIDPDKMQLLYQDDEGDKVLLMTDSDLVGAVTHARASGLKVLRLYLDGLRENQIQRSAGSHLSYSTRGWSSLQAGTLAGALFLTGVGLTVCVKRST